MKNIRDEKKTVAHLKAFPHTYIDLDGMQIVQPGLTKREYFAALIMQGLAAAPQVLNVHVAAKGAVKAAEALIEELNRDQE